MTTDPNVTTPVNMPATFKASTTDGTKKLAVGWSYYSGPTYEWHVASPITASPADASKTTINVPSYASAGTLTVTISCTVTDIVVNEDGDFGSINGSDRKTITVYVIGGPIDPAKSVNDIYWFCDSNKSTDWGHLSAAGGQPDGTTYSWSIAGNARFVGGPPTSADATYCGSGGGSTHVGDVKATVTYSLNNVTATSDPYSITVHAPTQFIVIVKGITQPTAITSGPDAYGFDGQSLPFQILDGMGQPVTSAHKACWDETWAGDGVAPPQIGDVLDSTGMSTDRFWWHGFPQPINAGGDKELGPFTHSYNVTDDGGGASGAGVGCFVKSYPNVIYNTYGVVGNGF